MRPDDRADRFAISDGASPATSVEHSSVSWDGAVTLGLGTLVLVLALGLGIGYIRRPKDRRTLSSRGQRSGAGSSEPAFVWSLGALGLARVEPFLEEDAQLLAGREHVLVARPARRQLHDPNVVVPVAVTASVGSCFIERRQRRATAEKAHDWGIS